MNNNIQLQWSKDKSLLSIQVMTDKLPGRPFPAWTVLCDIMDSGKILWNTTEAINFRKQVIAELKSEPSA